MASTGTAAAGVRTTTFAARSARYIRIVEGGRVGPNLDLYDLKAF